MHTRELRIETGSSEQVRDLTAQCRAFLREAGAGDGLLHVWVPHATRLAADHPPHQRNTQLPLELRSRRMAEFGATDADDATRLAHELGRRVRELGGLPD